MMENENKNDQNGKDKRRKALLEESLTSLLTQAACLPYAKQIRFYEDLSCLMASEAAREKKMPFLKGDTVYMADGMSECRKLEVRFVNLKVQEEEGRIAVSVTLKRNPTEDTAFGAVPIEECLTMADTAFGILVFGTKQSALDMAMQRIRLQESFR